MKLTKSKIKDVIDLLKDAYPDAGCALDYDSIFHLVIAVSLSAQTTDVSVNKVTPALFAKYPDPASLANADQDDVIECIRSIGMYKTKSKNIIAMARKLLDDYDGIVPDSHKELEKLPGVGRKTANVVMAEGFKVPSIPVDTHVFRVTNRIGLIAEATPLAAEQALMKILPRERWIETHHTFIFHGRNCCTARSPRCGECPIAHICQRVGL